MSLNQSSRCNGLCYDVSNSGSGINYLITQSCDVFTVTSTKSGRVSITTPIYICNNIVGFAIIRSTGDISTLIAYGYQQLTITNEVAVYLLLEVIIYQSNYIITHLFFFGRGLAI